MRVLAKAEALLSLEFTKHDQDRMRVLAEKARQGELSEVERDEAATYERIDSFLALVQSAHLARHIFAIVGYRSRREVTPSARTRTTSSASSGP